MFLETYINGNAFRVRLTFMMSSKTMIFPKHGVRNLDLISLLYVGSFHLPMSVIKNQNWIPLSKDEMEQASFLLFIIIYKEEKEVHKL